MVESLPADRGFPGLSMNLPQNWALGILVLIDAPSIPKLYMALQLLASSKTRLQKIAYVQPKSLSYMQKEVVLGKLGEASVKLGEIGSHTKTFKNN